MKCDFLIEAVGNIDAVLVDEAENFRPARKNRVWIWAAASAACLLLFFGVFTRPPVETTGDLEVKVCFAGEPKGGYFDYRKIAENGKVTITDELKALMDEQSTAFDMIEEHPRTLFRVRVTDANGADAAAAYYTCLTLGIRGEERERFISSGFITLSKKQIYAVKGSPDLALIIAPASLAVNEEYAKTVGRDTLNVWVFLNDGLDDLRKGCTDEEVWAEIKEHVSEFFGGYAEDYGIEDVIEFREHTGTFHAVLDTELVIRMLADERTEQILTVTE